MTLQTLLANTLTSLVRPTLLICLLGSITLVDAQQPGWRATGSLDTPRYTGHTATLLADGKVLVVGGMDGLSSSSPYWHGIGSAELYDPTTGQWSTTGSLISPRDGHFAVRLSNGKVLVAGGDNGYRMNVTTAEIYDPTTGDWSTAGNFEGGLGATATLLADGRVLVAGGVITSISDKAELYDPATGAWSQTGTMNARRSSHTATLLPDGKVLVAGGSNLASRSAELYDPTTGLWTVTGNLNTERLWDFEAALLPNGKVLVAGGGISGDDFCNGLDSAEFYDPATGTWIATGSPISTRNDYVEHNNMTLLPNGNVLLVGGASPGCNALSSAEFYDPATERWSATGSLIAARMGSTATLLANGNVLVVGGFDELAAGSLSTSAELYGSTAPTVQIIDNDTGSMTTLMVGDSFSFLVTGAPPSSLVFVSETGWSAPLGYSDASGSFRLRGTTGSDVVGTWRQTWTIGGVMAQPSPLQFTIIPKQ